MNLISIFSECVGNIYWQGMTLTTRFIFCLPSSILIHNKITYGGWMDYTHVRVCGCVCVCVCALHSMHITNQTPSYMTIDTVFLLSQIWEFLGCVYGVPVQLSPLRPSLTDLCHNPDSCSCAHNMSCPMLQPRAIPMEGKKKHIIATFHTAVAWAKTGVYRPGIPDSSVCCIVCVLYVKIGM